jgi:zinc knuckle protein
MVCFLCNKEGHVSASCPYRPRLLDKAIAIVALAFILGGYAWGHDAHLYDPECCGNGDCAPATYVTYLAANSASPPTMVVTTPLGTKPKTDKTIVRESKDHRVHGCIHQDRLWCVYLPPGN